MTGHKSHEDYGPRAAHKNLEAIIRSRPALLDDAKALRDVIADFESGDKWASHGLLNGLEHGFEGLRKSIGKPAVELEIISHQVIREQVKLGIQRDQATWSVLK